MDLIVWGSICIYRPNKIKFKNRDLFLLVAKRSRHFLYIQHKTTKKEPSRWPDWTQFIPGLLSVGFGAVSIHLNEFQNPRVNNGKKELAFMYRERCALKESMISRSLRENGLSRTGRLVWNQTATLRRTAPHFHTRTELNRLVPTQEELHTTNWTGPSHHARVDLAEARRAEHVEEQLLLNAGPHPQEEVEPRLHQVDSALRQPLLGVSHCDRQTAAVQLYLES